MSDHRGAALLLPSLPNARQLLGDKGYDSDWFRAALAERGITACVPPRKNSLFCIIDLDQRPFIELDLEDAVK